eukprot:Nitzschia sp. Nitz4//scaffold120_size68122//65636//67942//NITZ4_006056-RA/size68122-processed-gene-0.42-mRNA-1//1//CDS//3329534314//2638//frame0
MAEAGLETSMPPSEHDLEMLAEKIQYEALVDDRNNSKRTKPIGLTTPRSNPKLRLLTSSSTISLNSGSEPSSEEADSDWTTTTFAPEAPLLTDVGLMITMDEQYCQFQLVPDANFPEIHPHVYAPANISDMHILYGGGSGVAVFGGHHPTLGDIVMKHGGYKDANELFALATITEELHRRGRLNGNMEASLDMERRLPSFKMIYISPYHIMDRGKELVGMMKNFVRNWSLTSVPSVNSIQRSGSMRRASVLIPQIKPHFDVGVKFRIFEGKEEKKVSLILDTASSLNQSLSLIFPAGKAEPIDSTGVRVTDHPYETLNSVMESLMPIMTEKMFKFTLAQKTIGGSMPKTGNQWLYEGKLSGKILDNLMDQFIQVVHNLQKLTLPEEVDIVKFVREEVEMFEQDERGFRACDISSVADSFVGNAIKKNYHPEKGRQRFLRELCAKFREESLILTPEEELPAFHLGMLMRSGAHMSDTFVNTPMEPTVLQPHPHFWRNVLRRAVDGRRSMSKTALRRIWTCGLTDAGIHNLFVSETELFMFDLGEHQLMSLPGFLTKFLFSFFHTLGMEDDGNGSWVRRFDVVGDKLALTKETLELLPKAYDAFEECLDRVVEELLDGDTSIRWLLLEYVTMQLLSDTSFCLQKWEVKGGGKTRDGNHNVNQEKWLWRALWDIYVAFDINTADSWYRFDVVHPHFRENFRASNMDSFSDSFRSATTSIRNAVFGTNRSVFSDDSIIEEEDDDDDDSDWEDARLNFRGRRRSSWFSPPGKK